MGKLVEITLEIDAELKEQAELVIAYLKKLDQKLDDEEKDMVTDLICEMAVLYGIRRLAEI